LVERGQLDSISGPYPNEDARGRHGINGLRMRIDDPSLMQQLLSSNDVFRDGGRAERRSHRDAIRCAASPRTTSSSRRSST
jgi:hypothetical protein